MPEKSTPKISTFTPEMIRLVRQVVLQIIAQTPGAKGLGPDGTIAIRQAVLVKVMEPASGGEKYKAKLFGLGTVEIASSGNLTEEELGKLSETANVLFLNAETMSDRSGHVLTEDSQTPIALGIVVGYNTEDPPLLVVKGLSINSGCTTPS